MHLTPSINHDDKRECSNDVDNQGISAFGEVDIHIHTYARTHTEIQDGACVFRGLPVIVPILSS